MSDFLYIGSCVYEPKRHTRLEPLAVVENGCWRRYVEWTEALPPEGRAFSPSLPGFHENDLVMFRVAANVRGEGGRDKYLVASPEVPIEILDYRAVDDEVARRTIVEEGFAQEGKNGRKVLIALNDGTGVCLTLVRHPDGVRDVAATAGLEELALHTIDPRVFEGDRLRKRLYAVPGQTLGPQIGVVDWCLDTDFLKGVLSRLRRAAGEGIPFNRSQIGQLVQVLARARLSPSNGEDLRPITARLATFSSTLEQRVGTFEELVETVAALRPVADGLAEKRRTLEADLRSEIGPRIRAELEAAESDLTERRDRLVSEIGALEHAAASARDQAAAVNADLATARAALGEEMTGLLDLLVQVPGGAPVRQAANEVSRRLATVTNIWPAPTAPWAQRKDGAFEQLAWSDLEIRLTENAEAFGFDVADLAFADVAVRSGRVVLLPEADAAAFVRCHSGVFAGERWTRQVLDPAVISADDLWCRPLTSEPTAFSLAWTAAKLDPRVFRIVLLDGVHRTPFDLWAASFVDILSSEDRPANLLVFASYGPDLLDPLRAWPAVTWEMNAFSPERTTLNAEVLGRAVGKSMRRTWFDATSLPALSDGDVLRHIASMTPEMSASQVARGLAAVRAATPLASILDPAHIARVFSAGSDAPDVMRRGVDQVRLSLDPAKP